MKEVARLKHAKGHNFSCYLWLYSSSEIMDVKTLHSFRKQLDMLTVDKIH